MTDKPRPARAQDTATGRRGRWSTLAMAAWWAAMVVALGFGRAAARPELPSRQGPADAGAAPGDPSRNEPDAPLDAGVPDRESDGPGRHDAGSPTDPPATGDAGGVPGPALASDDCVRAFESSQRLRRDGKLIASRAQLRTCAQQACPSLLRNRCVQWLREVERDLPSVVVVARGPHGRDLVDVRVELDGNIVADRLDGRPLAVDPGAHRLRCVHPTLPPVSMKILVRQGQQNREVLVRFDAKPGHRPAAAAAPPGAAAPTADGTEAVEELDDGPPVSPLVWVGFGAGGAALVVGVVTGIVALVDGAALQEQCPDDVCTRDKEDDLDTGLTVAHVSTVSFIVAGVGAAVGVVGLALTDWSGPEDQRSGWVLRPTVGLGTLGLEGRF